jgi:hypothetical protein
VAVQRDLDARHLQLRKRRRLAADNAGDGEHEDNEQEPPHGSTGYAF